ncbi:MAG: hypothetical protein CME55_04550 [Halieaceae bacterium]|nr:hypothetical protein [Halieaceae bacterium]|tara:strand:+ start:9128 stop:9490 length:363 start_codon:yes stop_codon:yes gene_type:complete
MKLLSIRNIVIAAALIGVANTVLGPKYVPGQYGERDRISFSTEIWPGYGTEMSLSTYRYLTQRWPQYTASSSSIREYVDRAMLNYQYGYTFANGDALENAINDAVYYNRKVDLTWPIPKA